METNPIFLFSSRDSDSILYNWEYITLRGRTENAGLGRQACQGQYTVS